MAGAAAIMASRSADCSEWGIQERGEYPILREMITSVP